MKTGKFIKSAETILIKVKIFYEHILEISNRIHVNVKYVFVFRFSTLVQQTECMLQSLSKINVSKYLTKDL